jgi:hypothetical protein
MGDPSHSGDFEIVGVVEDTKYQDARTTLAISSCGWREMRRT